MDLASQSGTGLELEVLLPCNLPLMTRMRKITTNARKDGGVKRDYYALV